LLAGELRHYTYRDSQDRQQRIEKYAGLWAEMAFARGQRAGAWSAPLHGIARFFRGYVWRHGFLDGVIGWEIAMGNAREVFLKYRRLKERARA
jgi:(heptosyl)LPS beta-1,4-glucosyltransferase